MTENRKKVPRVSIGLPVHNGGLLLPRALDSILGQSFPDFELILSDNASTDATAAICRDYAGREGRIRYFRQDRNLGAAGNFNFTFAQATGAYFKWAAHDDVLAPGFLQACVDLLEEDAGAVLAFTDVRLVNEDASLLPYDPERGAFIDSHGKPWYWSTRPVRDLSSEDPVKRFAAVVARDGWCLEVFGLIRAEALRRTSLIGRYYGSDKVLLAELGTMGRFRTRGDPLFLRGCQPQQSTYLTPQEQARWIRGTAAGIRFDQANILFGCLGAALRRSLTPVERLRCLGWVLRRAARMEKLKRLVVPGPANYFGIGAGRRTG